MNIVVSAAALQSSGALTIYKQFISHLPHNIRDNQYYIFVSEGMPQPPINGVEYIISKSHTGLKRIIFDAWGCKHYLNKHKIKADYIICLQNTSINAPKYCQTIIYYHQSIPFYPHKWNPLKKQERNLFLYKYIYPIFVKAFLKSKTLIVVQTRFIKNAFAKYFNHPLEKIHVLFPDLTEIGVDNIKEEKLNSQFVHLIYPATTQTYKNHSVLCKALGKIKTDHPNLSQRIRLHLTIDQNNCPKYLLQDIIKNNIYENILFDGVMPFQKLLGLYKASDALVFPSTIETLGLPLIEAASLGLPIIVSDLAYAHEVLEGYDGASFVNPYNPENWATALCSIKIQQRATPFNFPPKGSWDDFFQLIN